jgi:hypothetical protein
MAKRKKAAAGRKRKADIIDDPAMPLLRGIGTTAPKPPKPMSAARRRAYEREKADMRKTMLERAAVRRAERLSRLARRPAEMQAAGYRLPADVAAFLKTMFHPGDVRMADGSDFIVDVMNLHAELEAAYMEGCRQGYIEGKVADLEPKRQRSRKANAAKRHKRQDCGGQMMTLDERDAAIVAEYPTLRKMLGSIEAQLRLADKYGLTSREQVGNIIRKAKQNGTA